MTSTESATDAQAPAEAPAEVRWLSSAEQRSWRSYIDGSARLLGALGQQLERDSGLSLAEYDVLVRLSEAEGHTLRMSALADEMARSRSWLTHTVRRMEGRGLVVRSTCADDGRGVNCTMTPRGFEALRKAAPGHVRAVREHLVDQLSAEQLATLGEAMQAVSDALLARDRG